MKTQSTLIDLTYTARGHFYELKKYMVAELMLPSENFPNEYLFSEIYDFSKDNISSHVNAIFCHLKVSGGDGTALRSATYNYTLEINNLNTLTRYAGGNSVLNLLQEKIVLIVFHDDDEDPIQDEVIATCYENLEWLLENAQSGNFAIDYEDLGIPPISPRRIGVSIIKK